MLHPGDWVTFFDFDSNGEIVAVGAMSTSSGCRPTTTRSRRRGSFFSPI